ncbi:MAG: large repetitive protein [Thermoanaerobaculia bacterium]|jgi:hypothetical protein|nr:large repetitive protein [Thermoanaerobaculia bacterium]
MIKRLKVISERSSWSALLLWLALLVIATPLWANTRTWSGHGQQAGGGIYASYPNAYKWSDPQNWDGVVPVDGDDVVFPSGADNKEVLDDLSGELSLRSITISDSYDLLSDRDKNPVIILGGGGITASAGAQIAIPITLAADQAWTAENDKLEFYSGPRPPYIGTPIRLGGHSLTLFGYIDFSWGTTITGSGAVIAAGGRIYTSAPLKFAGTFINNGAFLLVGGLDGSVPAISYSQSAGTLSGAGSLVDDVTITGGAFLPIPSDVFIGSLSLAEGATFIEQEGSCIEFCTRTARTYVKGTVNLGGATLDLRNLAPHSVVNLIDNDGSDPVVGTFAGLPEGATIPTSSPDLWFTITYRGGTGNDVVITGNPYQSTTSLVSSVNPSQAGQEVTFTASVTPHINLVATGTVTFSDSGQPLGTGNLVYDGFGHSLATFTTSALSVGPHDITATFPGNSQIAASTSPVLTQVVEGTATPPGVTFGATPPAIMPGALSTLLWSTTGATSVVIDQNLGAQPLSGSREVQPSATATYTLTATGLGGTTIRQATVTVSTNPVVAFIASPSAIAAGQSATLVWSATGATSVTIDHGIGPQPTAGSVVVSPGATTVYELTATGPGGTSTAFVTLTVIPPPEATLSAAPQAIVASQQATLTWKTTNATSVFIDHGIGFVNATGSIHVAPVATTTYVLTATGIGGTTNTSTTVIVVPPRGRAVHH